MTVDLQQFRVWLFDSICKELGITLVYIKDVGSAVQKYNSLLSELKIPKEGENYLKFRIRKKRQDRPEWLTDYLIVKARRALKKHQQLKKADLTRRDNFDWIGWIQNEFPGLPMEDVKARAKIIGKRANDQLSRNKEKDRQRKQKRKAKKMRL